MRVLLCCCLARHGCRNGTRGRSNSCHDWRYRVTGGALYEGKTASKRGRRTGYLFLYRPLTLHWEIMVYSFCPYCGTIIADPAWRFCPNCGGRLPDAPGRGQLAVPAAGRRKIIPAIVFAAGLFLVLIVATVFVQAFTLHFIPVPEDTNASTLPSPAILSEVPGTTGNNTMPARAPPDLNITRNSTSPEPPGQYHPHHANTVPQTHVHRPCHNRHRHISIQLPGPCHGEQP
jgi:hypothetical protein